MDTFVFIISWLVRPFFRIEAILALLIVLFSIFHFRKWKSALNGTIIVSIVVTRLTIFMAHN